MPTPLTAEEKADKKQRDNLKILHNRVKGAFSFHEINTWGEIFRFIGWDSSYVAEHYSTTNLNEKPTYPQLNEFLNRQSEDLEQRIRSRHQNTSSGVEVAKAVPAPAKVNSAKQSAEVKTTVESVPVKHPVSEVIDEIELGEKNNYGLHESPNEPKGLSLFWFQKKAAAELWKKIYVEKKSGVLLLAAAGLGKTYIIGALNRRLIDAQYHDGRTFSHIPYLYVTRNSVTEQGRRVLKNSFNIDTINETEVINIEALRSRVGALWVKEVTTIVNGEEETEWQWKKGIQPCVIFFDESHAAKNYGSTQHKIIVKYPTIPNTCLVSISATPFVNVAEAKYFAISTKREISHLGFPPGTRLNEANWPSYAAAIAAPSKPDEFNEAAVERLMNDLKDYVVRVKGVKPQFPAINKVEKIYFKTKEERETFEKAWNKLLEDQAKAEAARLSGDAPSEHPFAILTRYAVVAEKCRVPHLAERMVDIVRRKGRAAVCASKYKGTIIGCVKELITKYGVKRDEISLIWGGGQTQLTEEQIQKAKLKSMKGKLELMGMTLEEMEESLGLEDVEDRVLEDLPPEWRLGPQDKAERQKEIDKFQCGKSLYCFYTFKAGGVGLSVHHTDEGTVDWNRTLKEFDSWYHDIQLLPEKERPLKGKVRHKKSGYAVEEDIKFIPTRQRETLLAPTYSGIDMYQGLYRVPRLTSLSPTEQTILLYGGTVEDDIYSILSVKLRCIGAVIRAKENFLDSVVGKGTARSDAVKQILNENQPEDGDDGPSVGSDGGEDE